MKSFFSESCNKTFSSPTGTVSSPNYPMSYSNNLHCISHIIVNGASKIVVTLHEVLHECTHDWLRIYSGSEETSSGLLYDRYDVLTFEWVMPALRHFLEYFLNFAQLHKNHTRSKNNKQKTHSGTYASFMTNLSLKVEFYTNVCLVQGKIAQSYV